MKFGTALVLLAATRVAAQQSADVGRLSVRVTSEGSPLAHAVVRSGAAGAETNAAGLAKLTLSAGEHDIRVTLLGYSPDSLRVLIAAGRDTLVAVELTAIAEELSGIVVTSARGAQRIESEPLRIEVLAGEDVAEKTEMKPSDLRNFLSEMAGVRIQQLSATTGASSVRLQGLRPRYTLLLADGLPLYGGSGGGGLDLLQLPPADLRQIEVVKGPASALYGPSALGGMINLISKRPGHEGDVLLQSTDAQGQNAFGWTSREINDRFGYTGVIGVHAQNLRDLDHDGWAELPYVRRVEARPRGFYDWPAGHSLFFTAGATAERREGGMTLGPFYRERVDTKRGDVGIVGQRLRGSHGLLQLRAAANVDDKTKNFGGDPEDVRRSTGFAELSFANSARGHDFLVGSAIESDHAGIAQYAPNDYTFTTGSVFAQDAWRFAPHLSLSTSGRVDAHSQYGTFLSPRASLLAEVARGWTARVSATHGFYAPTPFVEEAEPIGVRRVRGMPFVSAEHADYGAVDVNGKIDPVEINGTVFASRVRHPVIAVPDEATGTLGVLNAMADASSRGLELFAVYNLEPLLVTALYTHTDSREPSDFTAPAVAAPYLPKNTGGLDITWEDPEHGLWIAVEGFYTGRQTLDRDPYRTTSAPYTVIGILASQRLGRYKAFVNVENLTDVRQSTYAPLLLPAPRATGEYTTGVWAPLEGRVFSAGLRISSGDLTHP